MTRHEIEEQIRALKARFADQKLQVDAAKTQLGLWELVYQLSAANEHLGRLVNLFSDAANRKKN